MKKFAIDMFSCQYVNIVLSQLSEKYSNFLQYAIIGFSDMLLVSFFKLVVIK
jgi:hypothetical protein